VRAALFWLDAARYSTSVGRYRITCVVEVFVVLLTLTDELILKRKNELFEVGNKIEEI